MPNISRKAAKIVGIVLVVYVLLVVAFESLLGFFQPEAPGTLVITTVDDDGVANKRVLTGLESEGESYVAVNHWPRAWYRRAQRNPHVKITRDGTTQDYLATRVTGAEHDRVANDNPVGIGFRLLTGFAPRLFIRLDPVETAALE